MIERPCCSLGEIRLEPMPLNASVRVYIAGREAFWLAEVHADALADELRRVATETRRRRGATGYAADDGAAVPARVLPRL
jgi:hypothetical protein